jgi:hemerythrin superfamily protein
MPNRVDEVISQGMGKVKAVKARIEGLVGVFNTLAEQHGAVAALLKRVQSNPEKRVELWPKIRAELLSHEQSEIRELYPLLRQFPETLAFADHHDEEARDMTAMIQRLDELDPYGTAWGAQFDELAAAVVHHATEEEEQKIFPEAQRVLGEDMARELDAKLLAVKQQIMNAH